MMATQGQRRPRRCLLEVALERAQPIKQVHQPPSSEARGSDATRANFCLARGPSTTRVAFRLARGANASGSFILMMLHYLIENNTTIYIY
jgi:hypothetical protein